ncbi:hypothetical protein [Streptomyces sp. WMMC897]|uniref:hypothetical protein n=1 Tax=Streptomyces sp. WMMC897 TaxID=3014782 RepID=UPI0022B60913|nr:hypothetical protein [Streptomyces sp. WMMC897]MCZ7417572.1 hypothetical protein [Streptomyces sp. WMMC897]
MNQHAKHRVLRTAAAAVCALLAAAQGRDLVAYQVPWHLVFVCGSALFLVMFGAVDRLVARFFTVRLSCPDCDFGVELAGADPAEVARWRAATANHPHHGPTREVR